MKRHITATILFLLFGSIFYTYAQNNDTRYLFAYFTDKNNNRNGLHLAWSEDGYKWNAIGPEHSFLTCDYGSWSTEKKMRDPFIMKGKDGLWHCVWTLNWESNAIGCASSKDLIHWSRQSYPRVMNGYEVRNCWAPEMTYDDEKQQYVIFWASTIKVNGEWKTEPGQKYDHRIYYTTTKDFKSFTPARLLFDPGYNVIDATIYKKDGTYIMIYKDERIYPTAKKELHVAKAEHAEGPYVPVSEKSFTENWVEGPAICSLADDSFIVYMDAYTRKRYEAMRTTDFIHWENVTDRISIPQGAKHGSIIKVDKAFVDNLLSELALAKKKQQQIEERLALPADEMSSLPIKADITVYGSHSKTISPNLFGIFFEDINYSADGGLYAELIQNRDFEYDLEDKTGNDPTWNSYYAWETYSMMHAKIDTNAIFSIRHDTLGSIHPNNSHYAVFNASQPGLALLNKGFDGIAVKKGERYDFSFFAKTIKGKGGKLTVRLLDKNKKTIAETQMDVTSKLWKKTSAVLQATANADSATLALCPQAVSTYAFDMVSLFPQKTFKGRKNGLRADLAQTIADIHPRFMRFPGGCLTHGDGLDNMYQWKETIGALEARKPQRNIWNYHQSKGLGFFEYFQFCEDIKAEPVPIIAAAVCCQNSRDGGQQGLPMCDMESYVQDIFDLIEYANGDASTKWGKLRAEAGHPEPFNLKYIGIGNEDLISDIFEERFTYIYNALKSKHPEINVIGTAGPFNEGTDYVEGWKIVKKLHVPLVDEHYYQSPGWFLNNQHYYDSYDRQSTKVYLGEYAAHLPGRPNNLEVALAEAIYMASLERNGDVVSMASYAPLLANEKHIQWRPDMIYFNNKEVKPSTNYYIQQMYGMNSGDEYLESTIHLSVTSEATSKRIAVSAVKDSRTGDLILKLINVLPIATTATISLDNFQIKGNTAEEITLSGKLDETNQTPKYGTCQISNEFTKQLPANSFTIIRVKIQ